MKYILLICFVLNIFNCNKESNNAFTKKEVINNTIDIEEEYILNARDFYGYPVHETGLNLRKEPNVESLTLISIPYDHHFELLKKMNRNEIVGGKDGKWYRIKYKEMEGYSFDYYFEIASVELKKKNTLPDFNKLKLIESVDWSGSTYSEYWGTIILENNEVEYNKFGITYVDCDLKESDPMDESNNGDLFLIERNIKDGPGRPVVKKKNKGDLYEKWNLSKM